MLNFGEMVDDQDMFLSVVPLKSKFSFSEGGYLLETSHTWLDLMELKIYFYLIHVFTSTEVD